MNTARKLLVSGALTGTAILGGALGASLIGSAGAATTPTTAATSTAAAPAADPSFPAHGSASHEDAEKAVTGDAATKAQAAAVKSVGSGTAGTVTSDFTGKGYETTVTKADGTQVEVHLDSSFTVMAAH